MSALSSGSPAISSALSPGLFGVVVLLVLVVGLLTAAPAQAGPPSAFAVLSDRSVFAGAQVDGLVWQSATAAEPNVPAGWVLDESGLTRGWGQLVTPVISLARPATELVPSWNAQAAPNSYIRVEVRALIPGSRWTPWYSIAVWPTGVGQPAGLRRDVSARVNEDTLVLTEPAQQVQLRATLYASPSGQSPRLRLLSIVGSIPIDLADAATGSPSELATSTPDATSETGTSGSPGTEAAWGRVLPVPFRSQRVEDPAIAGRICGPTSLSMILEYYGHNLPTAVVAQSAYDKLNGIYGNWPFLAAAAAELGLTAYVTRFPDWAGVEQEILAGHPVILSIHFGPGELPGAPINSTDGHLLVVRGFTSSGDVCVNDPAAWSSLDGQIVYDRQALGRAWENGVVIVVAP